MTLFEFIGLIRTVFFIHGFIADENSITVALKPPLPKKYRDFYFFFFFKEEIPRTLLIALGIVNGYGLKFNFIPALEKISSDIAPLNPPSVVKTQSTQF